VTPKDARDYIGRFHLVARMPTPLGWVDTSSGRRIEMATMTDDEAVQVALMLQEMEAQAGKPEGVPLQ
jgi:hypothetical protein